MRSMTICHAVLRTPLSTWRLSAALPSAAAVPPAILYGATQLWRDRQNAQRFARQNELLQRFQAPALRNWLARNPNFLAEPVRQEAAIVFIDLSGFTSFSEVTSAQSMRELLDDFYRLVEQDVDAHKGVITNFMGDEAMIVFGLPEPTAGDPCQRAALLGRARGPGPRMAHHATGDCHDAHRRQARRALRLDRGLTPWRRQPAADHRNGRQRQRREPADGGRRGKSAPTLR